MSALGFVNMQIAADLLLRPKTRVIATVRDPASDTSRSLATLPAADGSELVVFPVNDEVQGIGYKTIQERAEKAGINHLDVVVANAGASSGYDSVLATQGDAARACFEVNSIGPLKLFQACWPLLEKRGPAEAVDKKFILMSSFIGSIQGLETEDFPTAAYGMSKAAANWLAKKISVEFKEKGLAVAAIHPGWARTEMGQSFADALGVEQPPMTVEFSAARVIEQVRAVEPASVDVCGERASEMDVLTSYKMDKLCLETTGNFVSFDGRPLAW
ncbi:hypothetical protein CDD83_3127 [Cordyceps sp. RAO-2017]|nr:hypothetical protein CDD83_3127 [Cordyceps sp. RAO-2017]